MGDLPKIYADFGSEVNFEMVPFVYGSASSLRCFDERSPCIEEQTAFCVIDIAQKADASSAFPGQDKIVPWQICHSKGSSMETCHSQSGIDSSEVSACLNDSDRIGGLISKYLDRSKNVRGTPYELVNGKAVGSLDDDVDYKAVKKAICAADSSLSACSSVVV